MQQKFKILSYWYAFRISITSIKDKECEKFFVLKNKLKMTRTNIFRKRNIEGVERNGNKFSDILCHSIMWP